MAWLKPPSTNPVVLLTDYMTVAYRSENEIIKQALSVQGRCVGRFILNRPTHRRLFRGSERSVNESAFVEGVKWILLGSPCVV